MEDHEEIHSQIRWRRVCDIMDGHPVWKSVHPEDRKVSKQGDVPTLDRSSSMFFYLWLCYSHVCIDAILLCGAYFYAFSIPVLHCNYMLLLLFRMCFKTSDSILLRRKRCSDGTMISLRTYCYAVHVTNDIAVTHDTNLVYRGLHLHVDVVELLSTLCPVMFYGRGLTCYLFTYRRWRSNRRREIVGCCPRYWIL